MQPEIILASQSPRRRELLARMGLTFTVAAPDIDEHMERPLGPRALAELRIGEDRMAHATEILLQVSRKHLRWKELPTHVVYSDYSSAQGQGAGNAFNILWDLLLGQWI